MGKVEQVGRFSIINKKYIKKIGVLGAGLIHNRLKTRVKQKKRTNNHPSFLFILHSGQISNNVLPILSFPPTENEGNVPRADDAAADSLSRRVSCSKPHADRAEGRRKEALSRVMEMRCAA